MKNPGPRGARGSSGDSSVQFGAVRCRPVQPGYNILTCFRGDLGVQRNGGVGARCIGVEHRVGEGVGGGVSFVDDGHAVGGIGREFRSEHEGAMDVVVYADGHLVAGRR